MTTRSPDRIDVSIDAPPQISLETAWADLRAIIFNLEGADIEKSGEYQIQTKPIMGSGNRRLSALVAWPRNGRDAADCVARGYFSPFGEATPWMADCMAAAAQTDQRPCFAVPLATATRILN